MIKHHFGAGVYAREALVKKGFRVTKHVHSYDHLSILGTGDVMVEAGGIVTYHRGPECILIKANVEHSVTALTDVVWFCVHASDTEEIDDLDAVKVEHDTNKEA